MVRLCFEYFWIGLYMYVIIEEICFFWVLNNVDLRCEFERERERGVLFKLIKYYV